MSARREVLILTLATLICISLSGLPAWIHLSEAEHDHDSESCDQCQLLQSHSAVKLDIAVLYLEPTSDFERPLTPISDVLPSDVLLRLPHSRAPPLFS
jgi:hypothetical protein